jgi:PAS domain S-box-containing protein
MHAVFYFPDPSARLDARERLAALGHEITEATDLEGIARSLSGGSVDVVITERALPPGTLQEIAALCDAAPGSPALLVCDPARFALVASGSNLRSTPCDEMAERSPDPMGMFTQGRLVRANPAWVRLVGAASAREILGTPLVEIVETEDQMAFAAELRKLATSQEAVVLEERIRVRDGEPVWAEIAAVPVLHQGQPAVHVTARDVSARREAEARLSAFEEKLVKSQKFESLGALAGGIAHDFNNLLAAIAGHAELATYSLEPAAGALQDLRRIETAVGRAAHLTQQMLAYSGKGRFLVEPVDLTELVTNMAELLRSALRGRATLLVDAEPGLPLVEVDKGQIHQVVTNLVTNAADAMGDAHGVVQVSTGQTELDATRIQAMRLDADLPPGRYVWIEVSDTGAGMDDTTRARMFDPFFTTKQAGRGLGLPAALGIIRGHGGTFEVESTPGRGTRIRVYFPSAVEVARPAVPARFDTASDVTGAVVLVVEDEALVLEVVTHALEHAGLRVLAAASGTAGVEVYREHLQGIDLVLLDMTMPDMTGEEVLRELVALDPAVRVVLTSGYSEQEIKARTHGEHVVGFIPKPTRPKELARAICRAIASARA